MSDEISARISAIIAGLERKVSDAEGQISKSGDELRELLAEVGDARSSVQSELEQRQLSQLLDGVESDSTSEAMAFEISELRAEDADLLDDYTRLSTLYRQVTDFIHLLANTRRHLDDEGVLPGIDDAQQLAVRQAMIRAQEDERRRLSREIHDGPAQVLANAIIGLEFIERAIRYSRDHEEFRPEDEVERIRKAMREGLSEIRRFIFDLRPTMLSQRGLAGTIEHYVETYRTLLPNQIDLLISNSLPRMTPEQELTAFRVIQESLQNVHRHSHGEHCWITVEFDDRRILVTVRDDGRGFDPENVSVSHRGGSGIIGMRERAEAIGARVDIDSNGGEGCSVKLRIPRATTSTLDSSRVADTCQTGTE